jgi:nitroimidazol reductase NimA-like FMN-containing flavoprotein (pyridoxamine 5'-phosphate oxidase superfamily)
MCASNADESWRGKVGKMTESEIEAFFATDVVCRMGCLDDEGWPVVVPVWFHYRDGGYYIIPRERSAWARYLINDPRCYLDMDESGSQRKVLVKGEAQLIEEPNVGGKWVDIAEEMSVRYLGSTGPKYLAPTLNEPRWLFFVKPLKTTTWQGVDWPARYKHSNWGEPKSEPSS